MYMNSHVVLYLKSLNYEKVVYPCAMFSSKQNTFSQEGNVLSTKTSMYIPLSVMNDEEIQISADTDYALVGEDGIDAEVDENGELSNASKLFRSGAKVITYSSKKAYGSSAMQHWQIETE